MATRDSAFRGLERPCKRIRQIASLDEAVGQDAVQARPFFSGVWRRRAVREVVELQRIALDVVQLVFDLAALYPEINGVGPIAFASRADMAGRDIGRNKKYVVEREDRMILDARRWILHHRHDALAHGIRPR